MSNKVEVSDFLGSKENRKRIAVLITGRGGSRSIKDKNIHPVLDRPLLSYSIMAGAEAALVDEVFFTTDSLKLANVAESWGASIIMRPDDLGQDHKHAEAMVHGFEEITKRWGNEPEILVILMANCPTISLGIIQKGLEFLCDDVSHVYDSCVTVSQYNEFNPLRARKIIDGNLVPAIELSYFENTTSSLGHDRNSAGDFYFCDGAAWIIRKKCLNLDYGTIPYKWIGKVIKPLVQSDAFDVDNPRSLANAEFWLKREGFTESETPYTCF